MNRQLSMMKPYIQLMRLDRPIGIFLVMWPALWALWLAGEGQPSLKNVVIFVLGSVVMRSAGCVINDYADRDFDGQVERTKNRPLATGALTPKNALATFGVLCCIALALVLMTNTMTVYLSVGGLLLASVYPFMKRYTYLPQVFLGAAFAWAIPMAYSAQAEQLPPLVWLLFTATVIWTVAYDTIYAMVDREDDIKAGIKSTAILFGKQDRAMIATLQVLVVLTLCLIGDQAGLGQFYFLGVVAASCLFVYQQHLIRLRYREECFSAFLNNNWVGMVVFFGLVLDLLAGKV